MNDSRDSYDSTETWRQTYSRRLLKMPAWRVGVWIVALGSASVYVIALGQDALVSQVLAAFALGGAAMIGFGRQIP